MEICQRTVFVLQDMCCCNCQWHVNDYSHPGTDGNKFGDRRGYICASSELGYRSGWDLHGLCECWTSRPDKPGEGRRTELELWLNKYRGQDERKQQD